MTWFDGVALLLVIVVAWLESQRGFGRALFDLLGGIVSLKVASWTAPSLAHAAPVLAAKGACEAFWFSAFFLALAAMVVVAGKFIYETVLLSLDVLDPVVGAVFGFFSGMIVSHVFLKTLLLGYGSGPAAEALLRTFVGQELLKFRAYHTVVTALHNLGNW